MLRHVASQIRTVGVIGAGAMGGGIAGLCAETGFNVVVVEANAAALDNGISSIQRSIAAQAARRVKRGADEAEANAARDAAIGRISGSAELAAVSDADLVVEAIVENLDIKRGLFEQLGGLARPDAILATNTSSFPVTEVAEASGAPERVCGLHYFNPVAVMKLVEVVRTEHTAPAVMEAAKAFVAATGKVAVECPDTPGFIVNRLLIPYMSQAVAMLERGDATATDIDAAMTMGAGVPMGPLTLSDFVGHDVCLAVLEGWVDKFPSEPAFQVPDAMTAFRRTVADGRLGRKSGRGFFRWEGGKCVGE